jgi:2-polyprenyl-3-methyl-5-hydroxy-6-metoxy-1,4-benzoquinol methylase
MDSDFFIVDGKAVSAEECRRIFSSFPLADRQWRCLDWIEGETVIDIGCYHGAFVDEVARRHPAKIVLGVDYDPENLRIARLLYPRHLYLRSSVYALALADASVDCITFQEVIEHLEGAALAVKEINRVLKPGGVLVLSTPHSYYWRDIATFLVREMIDRVRGRQRLRTTVYFETVEWNRHIYSWSPSTLLTLLATNGFEYVGHQYSTDAGGWLESAFLRLFPFLGPAQIIKVRKAGDAPPRMI